MLSRRAEWTAWLLASVILVTTWILLINQARFANTSLILGLFLIFAAVGISLSNWMDRRTVLQLDADGVFFQNGLRKVQLSWQEIESIRVFPTQSKAKRVQVVGPNSYFEFRTLTELKLYGETRGRSGFAEGDKILDTMVAFAKLTEIRKVNTYTYYDRK